MFTGLIEGTATVVALAPIDAGRRLTVEPRFALAEPDPGESIAVDGVCLTLVSVAPGGGLCFDVIPETLEKTTLGSLDSGGLVNLERSLRLGDRLGGHLVQGHVDGTAEVFRFQRDGADVRLALELSSTLRRFVATKGSVALNGVSLTVAGRSDLEFEVALIPETLQRTNLSSLEAGSRVNVEVDLLARYLETMLADGAGP